MLFLTVLGCLFTVVFAALWYFTWVESGKHLRRAEAAEEWNKKLHEQLAYQKKMAKGWRDRAQKAEINLETKPETKPVKPPSPEEIAYVRKSLGQTEE